MNAPFPFEKKSFSLRDKAFISDPYPWYSWMRHNAPFLETYGLTLISRHIDVSSALINTDLSPRSWTYHINKICENLQMPVPDKANKFIKLTLAALDEPRHSQWQTAMLKAFSTHLLGRLRLWAKEEVRWLLTGKEQVDIINDCARFLWIRLFSRWMGLSQEQQFVIENKLASIRLFVDPGRLNETNLPGALSDLNDVIIMLEDAQENVNTSSDVCFFSDLKSHGIPGPDFSKTDVAVMAASILSGGGETTQALTGSLFYMLANNPSELKNIINNNELISPALNEVARFESPLQFTQRYAMKDTVVNGFPVKKGERLLLCLGSANRDESVFGDSANSFDIRRKNTSILTFGRGARHCIGSSLAKLQAETLLLTFMEKNKHIEFENKLIVWQTESSLMRCLETLIVKNNI
jgi:hypothetical protein